MARFFGAVAVAVLAALACSCLALPQFPTNNKQDAEEPQELVLLSPDANSGNLKFFFFPFNFWNGFKPLPWIPLPGLIRTTPKPEASGEDKDDDKDEEDDKDEDKDEDDKKDEDEDDEKDEDGDDDEENGDDDGGDDDENDE